MQTLLTDVRVVPSTPARATRATTPQSTPPPVVHAGDDYGSEATHEENISPSFTGQAVQCVVPLMEDLLDEEEKLVFMEIRKSLRLKKMGTIPKLRGPPAVTGASSSKRKATEADSDKRSKSLKMLKKSKND